MFASIPNFIEFYKETTNCSKEGPSCLRILNEVKGVSAKSASTSANVLFTAAVVQSLKYSGDA